MNTILTQSPKPNQHTVLSRENWSIGEHLSQYAPKWPNVNCSSNSFLIHKLACSTILTWFRVSFGVQHYFRCSVPASGYIFRKTPSVIILRISNSSQTKVTNLQRTTKDYKCPTQVELPIRNVLHTNASQHASKEPYNTSWNYQCLVMPIEIYILLHDWV